MKCDPVYDKYTIERKKKVRVVDMFQVIFLMYKNEMTICL